MSSEFRAGWLGGSLVVASFMLSSSPVFAQEGAPGFYRFPALHGDLIVFAAEGDLWRVSTKGGLAQRVTSHPAEEASPVISPDGATLAFTARYEGPAELYTMPIAGGLPVRHTYEAETSRATAWMPDGRLVYTTTHFTTLPAPELVALDLEGGTTSRVPLYGASEGTWDATGKTVFFARPAFHNNVTKRYTGGTARDVWKFTSGAEEAVELTGDYVGESHSPMWWNDRVYFVSDRDGTMNLFSMDERGADVQQHTRHSGWDVKNPALEGGRIVYQLSADLRLYDIATGNDALVPITLASDFDQLREKWIDDPMANLTSAHIHPDGESVVLTARGRVFVAPVGNGRFVQASRKPGVRYRDVTFMPDGARLLGLSDETGELEWVTIPVDGVGEGETLTSDGKILRFGGIVSPDARWVAYTDNSNDAWVLDVSSGDQRRVTANREGARIYSWSPDSRWLAFGESALNTFGQIKLFSVESGDVTTVTSDRVNSFDASWDADGDFLYFRSDRNLLSLVGAPWGSRQPEPYFDRTMEIYEMALRPGLRSPFRPNDELMNQADGDEAGSAVTPRVELDGIARRIRRVPVPAGNMSRLTVGSDALYWLSRDSGPNARTHLMGLNIDSEDPEPVRMLSNVGSFEISGNREKLLVRRGSDFYVVDARPRNLEDRSGDGSGRDQGRSGRDQGRSDLDDGKLDLDDWAFSMDVREDFRQLFMDAWRMERDYFYDPDMHGVDWDGVRDKYLPLVDRITTRNELSDLIGRVVGELSALHTSVRGGDMREGEDDVSVPTLGARLTRDSGAGGYRVDYIYQNDPDYPEELSPLADPELNVRAGDVIEAVNGVETLSVPHIGALLRNQADKQVRLRIRPGGGGGVREVIATPATNELNLRYSDWEYTRRVAVEEQGEGALGYVHLRAMGGGNLTEWYRNFYPVFNRQGLILDMRRNRGGNIDSFILEKLVRQAWMYWQGRVGEPTWNMQYAFRGHMVVLVDQQTASDGEAFADGFRRLGLGQVIGTRTWGGEIWLSSSNRLSDGGVARAPMTGVYGPEGEWLIEQVGIIPDIIVDNLPHATFNGEDAQLDAAIRHLQRLIENDPRDVPPPPAFPNKAFRYRATTDGAQGSSGNGGNGGNH